LVASERASLSLCVRSAQLDECFGMSGSQRAIRTLACLLDNLLSLFLGLEEGLNVLRLTGLCVELNHLPLNVRWNDHHESVTASGEERGNVT
jgi:hypothetical protein